MLARMYVRKKYALYTSARDAVEFYRMNVIGDQDRLCLPRTLFAAKTSARFKEEGVLFIGVFLPARSLHAWIFEDGSIVDERDTIWVNYHPVALIL